MDKLQISGRAQLSGEIVISQAKNAYLPILAAVILNDKPIHLKNIPNLADVKTMIKLLEMMGVKVEKKGNVTTFDASNMSSHEATYELVKTMRASIFVLGPLLSRLHKGTVSLPGGCAIGTRPIDLHLDNLKKLGADIELDCGNVVAKCEGGLKGNHVVLAFPSVGATENLMMAGVLAEGTTVIENAALEPEITDLANFLNAMGGKVSGIGTKTITVEGVKELKEVEYQAIGDRIEAGTYIMGALMTNSEVKISGFDPEHLEFVIELLQECGAKLEVGDGFVQVYPSKLKPFTVDTAPYPGFPTDLQAQMMALAVTIDGTSVITEHIFENRFMHVPELHRLGANITLKGKSAIIKGGKELKPAPVMCTDLRASAALVLAALATEGTTIVHRVYHLDRGYDNLESKLKNLGAKVDRVK